MGLGDMAKKAKQALNSEKGEQVSDQVLDRGADLANRVTGGKHEDTIDRRRDAIDERVGHDRAGASTDGDDSDRPSGRRRADTTVDAGGDPGSSAGRHRA